MAGLECCRPPGAKGVLHAAGVLLSEAMRSLATVYSRDWPAETVGERLVKGMWKAEAHLGVLGTVGKG